MNATDKINSKSEISWLWLYPSIIDSWQVKMACPMYLVGGLCFEKQSHENMHSYVCCLFIQI